MFYLAVIMALMTKEAPRTAIQRIADTARGVARVGAVSAVLATAGCGIIGHEGSQTAKGSSCTQTSKAPEVWECPEGSSGQFTIVKITPDPYNYLAEDATITYGANQNGSGGTTRREQMLLRPNATTQTPIHTSAIDTYVLTITTGADNSGVAVVKDVTQS